MEGRRRLTLVESGAERGRIGQQISTIGGTSREQVEYLADMIGQLQLLARRTGCTTLAGILELAQHEADLQRQRRGLSWLEPA